VKRWNKRDYQALPGKTYPIVLLKNLKQLNMTYSGRLLYTFKILLCFTALSQDEQISSIGIVVYSLNDGYMLK